MLYGGIRAHPGIRSKSRSNVQTPFMPWARATLACTPSTPQRPVPVHYFLQNLGIHCSVDLAARHTLQKGAGGLYQTI